MSERPEVLQDRMTGRSSIDALEGDLTTQEKIERFVSAEMELGLAERALADGFNKHHVLGEAKEIEEAVQVLQESASYRANQIETGELDQVRASGEVNESVYQAIVERQSHSSHSSYDSLIDRFEETQANEPEQSNTHDQADDWER